MNESNDNIDANDRIADGNVYESDVGDRPPSEAVIDVVAAIRNVTPTDLPPLYDSVDPEALDDFCTATDSEARPTVSFDYDGCTVRVHGSDAVAVTEQ